MKKIIFVLIGLLICCSTVKADMGPPMVTQYNIRIKNVSGTEAYNNWRNETIVIPYDTILEIDFEHDVDGELYGEIYYNNKDYLIKLSDVEIIKNKFDFSTWEKKPNKMYVYKAGAYLYNGPSKVYGKVSGNIELPVGTTIEYEYSDELWAYVEYNGVKGWVYIYSYDIGPYSEGSSLASISTDEINDAYYTKYYTLDEPLVLSSDPEEYKASDVIIPPFTKLPTKTKYYYPINGHQTYYYIEYNGKGGWILFDSIKVGEKGKAGDNILTSEPVKIYSSKTGDSNVIYTIPKYEKANLLYWHSGDLDNSYYYVEYNNHKGWITCEYDTYCGFGTNAWPYKAQIKIDAELYDNIEGNKINKIQQGTIVTISYELNDWRYVTFDSYKGWINITWDELKRVDEDSLSNIPENNIQVDLSEEEKVDNGENKTDKEKEDVPKLPKFSSKEIAIYCICGALVLTLVTIVIIKLVNKKKKKKNNNQDNNNDNIAT